MPEGLEAEIYRRAAERCVGRTVAAVEVDARQAAAPSIRALLPGRSVRGVRRHGKLVLVDLDPPLVLGLHFGMTGRLVVDALPAISRLEYGSGRDDPGWDRLVVGFADGGSLRVNDPRRWATFSLDPDVERLGPDFLTLPARRLADVVARRRAPVKAVLLDQHAIAGYGNLCVDEVLWQAAVAPQRRADSLAPDEVRAIAAAGRRHLPAMLRRGGSHCGTLSPAVRAALPSCPRDGAPLHRTAVAGRTTVWCPEHQR